MHNGAWPHFLRIVRQHMNQTFGEEWIGRGDPLNWPAQSSDLNPLDFWLWGHLKCWSLTYRYYSNEKRRLSGDSSETRNFRQCAHFCATKSWELCWNSWESHWAFAVEIPWTLPISQQALFLDTVRFLFSFKWVLCPLKACNPFNTLYNSRHIHADCCKLSWSSGTTCASNSGGCDLNSWHGDRLSWGFEWFSSALPRKCRDSASKKATPDTFQILPNSSSANHPITQRYPKWAVPPLGERWDYLAGAKREGGGQGTLGVDPSERVVRLFTTEVTLNQTLGNWYYFIKPIHCIKNLLTVELLNVVSYFIIVTGCSKH
jgi:hypothetical protein